MTEMRLIRAKMFQCYIAVGAGLLEDLPMSILSILLSQAIDKHLSTIELISIGLSWLCLGVKMAKLPQLKALLEQEKETMHKLHEMRQGHSLATLTN